MDERNNAQAAAEFLGCYGYVLIGAAAVCADAYASGGIGIVGVALAHGLALAALVAAVGPVSGGHVNPAVTLAVLLAGEMRPARAGMYVASQLLGAVTAGLTLLLIFGTGAGDSVALGTPRVGAGVAPGTAVLVEGVFSFLVVLAVLLTVGTRGVPARRYVASAPMIGAVMAAGVMVAGPITGGALNPARAFGPAFASGAWESQYVFWLGPMAGGVAAALAFGMLRHPRETTAEERFAATLQEGDEAIEEAERRNAEARARLHIVDSDGPAEAGGGVDGEGDRGSD